MLHHANAYRKPQSGSYLYCPIGASRRYSAMQVPQPDYECTAGSRCIRSQSAYPKNFTIRINDGRVGRNVIGYLR